VAVLRRLALLWRYWCFDGVASTVALCGGAMPLLPTAPLGLDGNLPEHKKIPSLRDEIDLALPPLFRCPVYPAA
jgi:hypothetical protein